MHRFFFLKKATMELSSKIEKADWLCFGQLAFSGRSTEGCNPFVAGCRGGSALLGSRGNAHWQVKGGSHYRVKDEVPWQVEGSRPIGSRVKRLAQGKLMPASTCTGYYLTQNFAGLAALPPSPAQNIFAGRRKKV